jgi:hypothetical protein
LGLAAANNGYIIAGLLNLLVNRAASVPLKAAEAKEVDKRSIT